MKRLIATAALLASLSGCEEPPILIVPDFTWTDEFFQDPEDEVDILLVVDNSCSMLAEQEKLAEEFEAFVEFFTIAQTDYHIGITTTDMRDQAGRLIGVPNVITRGTPNPAAVFRNNVLVGAKGSGFEKGFEAAWTAVSPALREGINAGFYRDDAALAVIFVSDEDDGSPFPVDSWVNAFWELKGQRNRDKFRASALTGVHQITGLPAECGRTGDDVFAGADDAPRYWDLVEQTGGVNRSICAEEFNGLVVELGLASSGLRDRFNITFEARETEPVEIVMFVPGTPEFAGEGLVVPPEGVDGQWPWVFEGTESLQWIRFVDLASLPPLGTRILVTYERVRIEAL